MAYGQGLSYGMAPVDPASFLYETEEERRRRLLGLPSYDDLLQQSQQDPVARGRLLLDATAPADVKAIARDQERSDLINQRAALDANRTLQTGDPQRVAQAMTAPREEGNILKLLGYKALGMTNLALDEERKLGAGRTSENVSSPDGRQRARITFDAFGRPLAGYDQTGRELNEQELRQFSTFRQDSGSLAGLPQKGDLFVDRRGNAFRETFNPRTNGSDLLPVGHNEQPFGQLIRSTQDFNLAAQQAGGRAFGGAFVEQRGEVPAQAPVAGQPVIPQPTAAPAAAAPARPVPPAAQAPAAPPVQAPVPQAQAAPAPAPAAAPAPAPTGGTGPAALRPTTPNLAPVGTAPAAGGTGIVPPGQYKSQQQIGERKATEAIETAETEPRENIKINAKRSAEVADNARKFSREDRTLDSIIRYTNTHPQFFGEWIGSETYRMFKDAQTDSQRRDALDRMAQNANIKKEDRPEFQKLMNEIRRIELTGITSSGLSASQLNTEKESERAVKALAPSITDTAESARVQAMIAKADIEYNREFSRFYARADKKLSPTAIQSQFDDQIGDAIYQRLRDRIDAMRAPSGGRPAAGTGRTSTNIPFRVVQ